MVRGMGMVGGPGALGVHRAGIVSVGGRTWMLLQRTMAQYDGTRRSGGKGESGQVL
jgi:hypothetical protein